MQSRQQTAWGQAAGLWASESESTGRGQRLADAGEVSLMIPAYKPVASLSVRVRSHKTPNDSGKLQRQGNNEH